MHANNHPHDVLIKTKQLDTPVSASLATALSFSDIWRVCGPFRSPSEEALHALWHKFTQEPGARAGFLGFLRGHLPPVDACQKTDLPLYCFYIELRLIHGATHAGHYQLAMTQADAIARHHPGDWRIDDIRARVRRLKTDNSPLKKNLRFGANPFGHLFCEVPYRRMVFAPSGDVINCCAHWLKTQAGHIEQQDFDAIWSSPNATAIRRSVTQGAFEFCNKMHCPKLRDLTLPAKKNSTVYAALLADDKPLGLDITLSHDPSCNLTCPSCRSGVVAGEPSRLKHFETAILPALLEKDIRCLHIAGFGDPFASPHYRQLLESLDPSKHRISRLFLLTNGLKFDPDMWTRLKHLQGFDLNMGLSIDAASADTYHRLRRGGHWNKLQRNLAFIAALKQEGVFRTLTFNFVIQEGNFQEMPAFTRMALDHGASVVKFLYLHEAGEFKSHGSYANAAVHLPTHPRYSEFVAIKAHPDLLHPFVAFM